MGPILRKDTRLKMTPPPPSEQILPDPRLNDLDIVEDGQVSMGDRAAGGAIWMGASQAIKIATSIISAVVVARLLTPDDYGVIGMVGPVMTFLIMFQDLGFSQAVVQAKSVSTSQVNALFWACMGLSALIGLLLVGVSPWVAAFYHDPRVQPVIAWSAITVLIGGAALQHAALLTRSMRFRDLAIVEVCSAIAGLIVSIGGAMLLKNYWALWLGALGSALVQTIMLWMLQRWTPSRNILWSGMSQIFKFGGGVTGFNIVNYAVRNADTILIARFSSAAALGLYTQSYKLMMAPMLAINGPLGRVMMPILSRLNGQAERYRTAFLSVVTLLMLALTPGLAVVAAKSAIIVPFLLGQQWAAASPIFFWLSLTGLIQPLANATGWLFLSSGRTGAMFSWGIVSAVITLVGFAVGIRWGAEGIAAALFWTALLRMPPLLIWCVRGTPVSAFDLFRVIAEPLATTLIVFMVIVPLFAGLSPFWSLAASSILAYAVGVALTSVTPSGRAVLMRILGQTTRMLARLMPLRTK